MSDYNSCQELNLVPQELSYEHCTVRTEAGLLKTKVATL